MSDNERTSAPDFEELAESYLNDWLVGLSPELSLTTPDGFEMAKASLAREFARLWQSSRSVVIGIGLNETRQAYLARMGRAYYVYKDGTYVKGPKDGLDGP